jgi:hypothetical protein
MGFLPVLLPLLAGSPASAREHLEPDWAAGMSQLTEFSLKACGKKATTAASQHAAGVSALELWPVSTIMRSNGIVALGQSKWPVAT